MENGHRALVLNIGTRFFHTARCALVFLFLLGALATPLAAAGAQEEKDAFTEVSFPKPLTEYKDEGAGSVIEVLKSRAKAEPFNVIATVIFLLAILHTFFARKFTGSPIAGGMNTSG